MDPWSAYSSSLYSVSLKSSIAGANTVFSIGNSCNLLTNIQGYTGTTDIVTSCPIVSPFGFIGIPDSNYIAAVGNMGIRSQQPIVLGYSNTIRADSALDLQPGESGIFSVGTSPNPGLALEMKLTEMRAKFHSISCKIMNGDSTNKILLDLLGELIDYFSYFNTNIVAIYNLHTHTSATPGSPTGTPNPPNVFTPYTESFPLATDQTYLTGNHGFIDNNGTTL